MSAPPDTVSLLFEIHYSLLYLTPDWELSRRRYAAEMASFDNTFAMRITTSKVASSWLQQAASTLAPLHIYRSIITSPVLENLFMMQPISAIGFC